MLGRLSVLVIALFLASTLFGFITFAGPAAPGQPSSLQASVAGLPPSLDDLYPPKANRPVFFLAMHELNAALTGVAVDVMEDDREGALPNFEILNDLYRESAQLVPEWESRYPSAPVEELGQLIATADPGQIMAAVGRVGAVCHDCHLQTMVPAQFKYHWPDFGAVTVEDPVTGAESGYPEFMQMLNAGLTGVAMDIGQGQPENARVQMAAFRSRMVELSNSCDVCHDTERRYFVDEEIETLLGDMDRALEATSPDPAKIAALSRSIGEESCTRCHLVHMPAAYSRSMPR